MSRLLAILIVTLLSGCGFHLQGELRTPPEMQSTYIDAVESNSLFHRELRQQLLAAGVNLVDSPADATAIFSISIDLTGQRVLSVSTRNVPTEFDVFYSVEYALTSGEKILLAPQFVTLMRNYTYDETLVLGKAHEEDRLREAIVQDIVRLVLKQLSSL